MNLDSCLRGSTVCMLAMLVASTTTSCAKQGPNCETGEIACTSGSQCASGICNGCCVAAASTEIAVCQSNSDCPDNAACVDGTCQPLDGGTTSNGACSMDSDCSEPTPYCVSSVCVGCRTAADCPGAHQTCNSDNSCGFDPGFCGSNTDCAGTPSTPACNQVGVCVQCVDNTTCPNGDTCDTASEMCTTGSQVTCTTSQNCQSGESCIAGVCVGCSPACVKPTPICDTSGSTPTCVECEKTSDCKANYTCTNNTCIASSTGCSPACSGTTPYCDTSNDTCVECLKTSDCGTNQTCQSNTCVTSSGCSPSCSGTTPYCDTSDDTCVECLKTSNCDANQTCVSNTCVTNSGCSPACSGSTAYCNTTDDQCVQCLTTSNCGTNQTCQNYACVTTPACSPACSGTTPYCDTSDDTCVQCLTTSNCGTNQTCVSNSCVTSSGCSPACSGTTPVCDTSTSTCVQCLKKSDCSGSTSVCDTSDDTCVQCMKTSDCGSNQTCTNNTCVTNSGGCTETIDCPAGDTCQSGSCATATTCTSSSGCTVSSDPYCNLVLGTCVECQTNSDCSSHSGQICLAGTCEPSDPCTSDESCGTDEACVPEPNGNYTAWDLECFAADTTGSEIKGGGPCTKDADCYSGYCELFTSANGICIDACTSASDCASGDQCPASGVVFTGLPGASEGTSATIFTSEPVCWPESCTSNNSCEGRGPPGLNWACGMWPATVNSSGDVSSWIETCLPNFGRKLGGEQCSSDTDCASDLCVDYGAGGGTEYQEECFQACTSADQCPGIFSECATVTFGSQKFKTCIE